MKDLAWTDAGLLMDDGWVGGWVDGWMDDGCAVFSHLLWCISLHLNPSNWY